MTRHSHNYNEMRGDVAPPSERARVPKKRSHKNEHDEEPRLTNPCQPLPIALETTLRMTLTALLSYTLAVVHAPSILPPSQQWLIGLLGTVVIMRIPNMIFTVGGMLLAVYVLVLFGLGSATLVLYCVTVGDADFGNALMTGVATLWAFWMSGFRYGPLSNLVGIFPSLLIAVLGLLVLNLHRFIRDGLELTITSELIEKIENSNITSELIDKIEQDVDSVLRERLPQFLVDLIEFGIELLQIPENILENGGILKNGGIRLSLPYTFGDFAGQFIFVELNDEDDLLISVDGGSWWLKGFWTWTGTENTFAVMTNFLIICSWSFFAVYCAHFMPPWRTMRYQFARLQLPQALRDAAWYVKSPTPKGKSRLQRTCFETHSGVPAIMTALEPRFADWRFNWPRCTFVPLFKLNKSVETAMIKTLLLDEMSSKARDPTSVSESYRINAQALIDRVPKRKTADVVSMPEEQDPLWLKESEKELGDLTDQYLESMKLNPTIRLTAKDKLKQLLLVTVPFLAPPIAFLALVFIKIPLTAIKSMIGRERFDLQKAIHHVKFAIGFGALFAMSVYWDVFHDFDIATRPEEDLGVLISAGNPIGSFSGWQLVAYAFCTMPTTEGTFKKCVLRVIGTLLGAFSAWSAIEIAGTSDVGLVIFLTLTTSIAAFVAVDKGDLAERSRMKGTSPDCGYIGFYWVLTQAVICMEFLFGAKDGNELVVNRIVSNMAGILMASILAIIPPGVYGGDTKWTQLMVSEATSILNESIEALLKGDFHAVAARKKQFVKLTDTLRSDALYLLEDAKRLQYFPIYRVDTRLEVALMETGTTCSFVSLTLDRIETLAQTGQLKLTAQHRQQLELILVGTPFKLLEVDVHPSAPVDVLIHLLRVVQRRLAEHTSALEAIRNGDYEVATEEAESSDPSIVPKEETVKARTVRTNHSSGEINVVVVDSVWC